LGRGERCKDEAQGCTHEGSYMLDMIVANPLIGLR
jgi:hypothetical protein